MPNDLPHRRYATNQQMLQSVEHGAKNRLATVFFYLNNVTNDEDVTKVLTLFHALP